MGAVAVRNGENDPIMVLEMFSNIVPNNPHVVLEHPSGNYDSIKTFFFSLRNIPFLVYEFVLITETNCLEAAQSTHVSI